MREERIRRNRTLKDAVVRQPVGVPDTAPEWGRTPEDIATGVRLLLQRTGTARKGYLDCLAIEQAAGELGRLAGEDAPGGSGLTRTPTTLVPTALPSRPPRSPPPQEPADDRRTDVRLLRLRPGALP